MSTPKDNSIYYTPIPPPPPDQHQHHHHHHHHYTLLPFHSHSSLHSHRRLIYTAVLLLLAALVFFLWPSNPDLKLTRLRLNHIHIHTHPRIAIDISLALTIKVHNRDLYSIDYKSLDVAIGYRGRQLGLVTSEKGHLKARGSSFVDAMLEFDGIEVFSDVIYLLEDLRKGLIPFETVTEVNGWLRIFFISAPLKAKLMCEVYVNTINQTVTRQNCFPD